MKKAKIIICIAALIFATVLALYINERANEKVVLTEYTFSHKEMPKSFDGYKILVVSDLHNAPFAEQIIEYVDETSPDLIAFTGDMVQLPDYDTSETEKIVAYVGNSIPMYAVSGNHETQNGEYDHIMGVLWDNGIIHLEHDSVILEKNGEELLLVGIRDPQDDVVDKYHAESINEKIKDELSKNDEMFSILLSHRADIFPMIKNSGVDLILSGHLHGGIIRLPFVGGVIGEGLLPHYEYGVYEEDFCSMIVSGGCDKNPEKKRYFNPPEVLLVTLKAE